MKSIKSKVILLVLSSVIFSSLSIGIIGFWSSHNSIEKDSITTMNLLCENKANSFNEIFKQVEHSLGILSVDIDNKLKQYEEINLQNIDDLTSNVITSSLNIAENTNGAVAIYLRFDPKFGDSKNGFFAVKDLVSGSFQPEATTDLSLYSENDREHVSWFYEPKNSKKATWIEPYNNKNINVKMISYVSPIYINDSFIGVVGMDINFDELTNIVGSTSIYETGYAFLANSKANIVYHENIQPNTNLLEFNNGEFEAMAAKLLEDTIDSSTLISYSYRGINKEATFRILQNGMRFILTAPKREITYRDRQLLIQMIFGVSLVIALASVITLFFTKRLVKPLLELTEAVKKVSSGDLNVSIKHRSNDEIGILSDGFQQTVSHLNESFMHINKLAYKDSLTGVKNKTAYIEAITILDNKINEGIADFTLVVFDLNNLKFVNDSFGHDIGDLFIISASRIICRSFRDYPVYRIGGDEFITILENYKKSDLLVALNEIDLLIEKQLANQNFSNNTSMAYGYAIYSKLTDKSYIEVFKRADNAMYQKKVEMKSK